MKVFFERIFRLDQEYQEILIDENNFNKARYLDINMSRQNINGMTFDDVYTLEPLNYYQVTLKSSTPYDFNKFYPSIHLLKSGLIVSDIDKDSMTIYIYNCTQNHVYIRSNAVIGRIE